ncbi:N-ethylmaleimide reductase, partial [Penicillium argentinense]
SNDPALKCKARSHAVGHGLRNKRKLQQNSSQNFRIFHLGTDDGQGPLEIPVLSSSDSLGPSDPFRMLALESPKLQALLSRQSSRQPMEPVFSVFDELVLPNFRQIIRNEIDDHALLNAIMLTFSLRTTSGRINSEFLAYQNEVLRSIRQRMDSPESTISESTLGTIVLLAGVEAQLGLPSHVQLHMGAVHQILNLCRKKGIYLSDSIKRAIFWSDLNASVMTGSCRVVDHTTFSELQWKRDPFTPNFFILPPGFQTYSQYLGRSFCEVLKDVFALQCIRESGVPGREDAISMAHIDNHHASIQSRLLSLPGHSCISKCCHVAAYLCSTMLRCKLWRTSTIPSHLSLQLLCELQQATKASVFDASPDLLTWLLHIGGAFAPAGAIRSGYIQILHAKSRKGLYISWPELLGILKQFIWSDKAFLIQVKTFWEETALGEPTQSARFSITEL